MNKPWECPDTQAALSRKHIPLPHSVVPVTGGYALFECRGAERRLVAILPDAAALADYLSAHYAQASAAASAAQERAASRRLPIIEIDFSL